jgi:hypothetical protein
MGHRKNLHRSIAPHWVVHNQFVNAVVRDLQIKRIPASEFQLRSRGWRAERSRSPMAQDFFASPLVFS